MKTLVLTSNNFAELADLDTLKLLPKLTHLSLLDNAVTRKEVRFFFFFCPVLPPTHPVLVVQQKKMERSYSGGRERGADIQTICVYIALSALDNMALPQRAVFRLPKS